MFDYEKFYICLKSKRKALNYSIETLADKIGIGYKHLGNIERGQARPSIETIVQILNVFNCSLNDYLGIEYSKKDIKINEILANVKSLGPNEAQKELILDMCVVLKKKAVIMNDGD